MSRRPKQTCAVCGMGGYWVGYSAEHGEDRCVNHLHTETIPMALEDDRGQVER